MSYRGQEIPVFDLTGGQASNRPVTSLKLNQALEVDNVHSLPGGGIQLRQGDTEVNAIAFASGAAWTGLQYFKQSDADEFLVGVAGTAVGKIDYSSGVPDGTVDTITGGLTITSSQDNFWTSFVAGDEVYFVGGAPDAAFSWDGVAGTATAVGGTFPAGRFGFFHNNRIFVGSADGTRSRLSHSTLTDIEDFTGDGSGNIDVDANDGDTLVAAAPLNTDVVLLFKQNSIHHLTTTSAPFPRFPLFKNTGAIGNKAIVTNEGLVYYITSHARMKATNGSQVIDFPSDMDDVWDEIPRNRLPFIVGYFEQGKNFRQIRWSVTKAAGSDNALNIIWDLDKKSWWKYTSGHDINVVTTDTTDNIVYAGHYDGKIYTKNVANIFTDASESGAGISGLWRWGWQTNNSFQVPINPRRLNISVLAQIVTAFLRIKYGFDFDSDTVTEDVNLEPAGFNWDSADPDDFWDSGVWSGATDSIENIFLKGRGNAFQLSFTNQTAGQPFRINGFTLTGKQIGQKEFTAT